MGKRVFLAMTMAIGSFQFANSSPLFAFTKIADTSTPIPGGVGDFTGFDLPIAANYSYAADGVGFVGYGAGGQSGVYSFNLSGLTTFANTSTADPGGNGTFTSFSSPSLATEQYSFIATTSNGTQGVYAFIASPNFTGLQLITTSTEQPGGAGATFGSFSSVSGGAADWILNPAQGYPTGIISSNAGIYYFQVHGGTTSFLPLATSSTFSSFGPPQYLASIGGNIPYSIEVQAMNASVGGVPGIYYGVAENQGGASGFGKLVGVGTPSIQNFTSFGQPSVSDQQIAFTASYSTATGTAQGLFVYGNLVDGSGFLLGSPPPNLVQIAGSGDVAPGSGGAHFENFLAVADGMVLAQLDNGVEGLYQLTYTGPGLSIPGYNYALEGDVIDTTDMLDGKSIQSFGLAPNAGNEGGDTFEVNFTDGSQGIYYFALPEPGGLVLLGVAGIAMMRRRR